MKQIYIIHSYTASPDSNWFPALEKDLSQLNIPCHRLTLPNSITSDPQKWFEYLKEQVTLTPIGHSLGCIAGLTYLTWAEKTILSAIFVSSFMQKLPTMPELDGFINSYEKIKPHLNPTALFQQNACVISAYDDQIIRYTF